MEFQLNLQVFVNLKIFYYLHLLSSIKPYNICFESFTCYPTPQTKRRVPLPELTWADKDQVWNLMCRKDKVYKVDPQLSIKTPSFAVEDEGNTVRLVNGGITCLFIAAKIEEIYPPKLSEFSYVTDGACTDEEILEYELIILKGLQWSLSPVTSNCWLNTYLQLLQTLITQKTVESYADSKSEGEKDLEMVDDSIIFPRYSGLTFVQVSRLLDLCALDSSSLVYSPSLMAATALSYLVTVPMACMVSGYNVEDLRECHAWMAPLAIGIQELGPATLKYFNQVAIDDAHNIQTHNVPLAVLERALDRRSKIDQFAFLSPSSQVQRQKFLTPPKTDEKTRSS
ncbi:G1/S-specific cyclin-E1 [Armadillidium nasatum]|uniref:G1/S-specific cyclin-E1 n=1 Tax=Armadillidium nasatum TaxID=96803 RepID=A0A5N5THZ0_9CRUS|nr:G1/S-specific cyclin-E1 [Armadillidium nasatum]